MILNRWRSWLDYPTSRVGPRTRGPRARPKAHHLSIELLEDRLVLDTVSWKAAVSGNWNNPANWNANRVPGAADTAVIDATGANYTVTLDVNATVAGFTLNAANATFFSSGRMFTANGPATLSAGMVQFRGSTWAGMGPLTNNATITIDSNVNAGDSTTISSPFVNGGRTLLIGPAQGFINGSFTTADGSLLRVQDGNLTVANGFTNNGTIELLGSPEFSLPSILTVSSGTLTNAPGKTINFPGGNFVSNLVAQFNNQGTITVAGPTNAVIGKSSAASTNSGTLTATAGSLQVISELTNTGTISFPGGNLLFTANVTNTGTIMVPSGRSLATPGRGLFTQAGGTLMNDGSFTVVADTTFRLTGGTVTGSGIFTIEYNNGFEIGNLQGFGTLGNNVVNKGTIAVTPASSGGPQPGLLNITGNYTQTPTGGIAVLIGGPTPGTGFGQLNVSGSATLDGTLDASLINDFSPSPGSTFTILTRGSGSGTFKNLPDNATLTVSGQPFRINYTPTAVVLTRTGAALTTTTTSVSSSANPSVVGRAVTFTATVTAGGAGTPSGTVTFTVDGTAQAPAALSGGTATLTTSTLAVGMHTVTAAYSGDGTFSASSSVPLTQTVNQAVNATTTTLTSSANPSLFGQAIAFTATVVPTPPATGTPTGTVSFSDGTTTLGTATLVGGRATFAPSTPLSVGMHSLLAVYGGDSNFAGSTSAPLTQTVNAVAPGVCTPQQFLAQVYVDLLRRPIEPDGQTFWLGMLNRPGVTRSQVVLGIEGSQEYHTLEVRDLYQQLLHRAPDSGGLNGWVNFLNGGGTDEQLEVLFLDSPEYFQTRGGGSNTGFLRAVYQDVLGRAVDPSGAQTWGTALSQSVSRTQIAQNILASQEADTREVQNFYLQFLRRAADVAGLNAAVAGRQVDHRPFGVTTAGAERGTDGNANSSATASTSRSDSSNSSSSAVTARELGVTREQLVAVLVGSDEYCRVAASLQPPP